jgi:histone deacetylase 1/2
MISHITHGSFPYMQNLTLVLRLLRFFTFITTQYHTTLRCLQCDKGGEFLSTELRAYLSSHGISLRLLCPYTSAQNDRAERLIRTTNDVVCTLLFQTNMPPLFLVEALHTANHLLNIRPSRAIGHFTPYFLLHGIHPTYDHLRVFGCLCFPNLSPITTLTLPPRSSRCILLGCPREHKGYRCFDLTTRKVIISRHVTFDENIFPFTPVIRLIRIYNFLCSMLVLHQLLYFLFTLCDAFMHFLELTY